MVKRYDTVFGSAVYSEKPEHMRGFTDSGFVDEDGVPIYVPAEDVERARG